MWTLVDQLIQQGVVNFFLAPGSRSTPLAVAIASHPKAQLHTHFDERGLAFYALGCALATEKPTVIIVTSGTAVGNLLPAVMEAHHSSIPLILLTADRPPELRETSANQTTDQTKIFQNFVRWQFDLDNTMPKQAIRSKAAQAYYRATTPHPGPVHINCPLKEPLYTPLCNPIQNVPIELHTPITSICASMELPSKGIILLGRTAEKKAVLKIAEQLGWPVLADILSSARLDPTDCQIKTFDWFLKEAPRPECVLHFGERLTSKRLMEWLAAEPPSQYWHISPYTHWCDPCHLITSRVHAPIEATRFHTLIDPSWLSAWKTLDQKTEEKLSTFQSDSFTETAAIHKLNEIPFDNWAIFLANSMPIREGDWFLFPKKAVGFYANRGLSGIDGNLATIAGLSLKTPVFAIVGDLATLHDLNSLALLKDRPIVLLISNNNGGGIFSHLAVASDPNFETLWAHKHNHSFKHAATLFNIPYTFVNSTDALAKAVSTALAAKSSHIIEMVTCRHTNASSHKQLREALK